MSDDLMIFAPSLDALIQARERVQQLEAEVARLRLTDEERHAIAVVRGCAVTRAERFLTQSDAEREATLVLWRLQERLGSGAANYE